MGPTARDAGRGRRAGIYRGRFRGAARGRGGTDQGVIGMSKDYTQTSG